MERIVLVSQSALSLRGNLDYNRIPPNLGYPFDRFEEGQWYHPQSVTADYLDWIYRESERRFGKINVRNRHSWYMKHGFLPIW